MKYALKDKCSSRLALYFSVYRKENLSSELYLPDFTFLNFVDVTCRMSSNCGGEISEF